MKPNQDRARLRMEARLRSGCGLLGAIGLLVCLALVGRAAYLQVVQGGKWREIKVGQAQASFQVPVYRGTIWDRRGRPLALSVQRGSLYADAKAIESPERTTRVLASILGVGRRELRRKLNRESRFVWIKRGLSTEELRRVSQARVPGLGVRMEWGRYYPHRSLAGQVIGFVGVDGMGLEGVERVYDGVLRQDPRKVSAFRDGGRRRVWIRNEPPPVPQERYGLRLNLDAFLQDVCEAALEDAVRKHGARAGEAVLLDVRDFRVLAMANWPPFNPNTYASSSPSSWRNRVIADAFEPGSAMKIFLMAGVLEAGVYGPEQRIFCEEGEMRLASHTIHDVHPHGWLTVRDVLKVSSNIGAVKLAQALGPRRYYEELVGFGFGRKTDVDLPGESAGLLRSYRRWRPVDFAVAAFGQGVGVTSLQLASAVAAVANGGLLGKPRVADAVVDEQGRIIKSLTPAPRVRVVSQKTARRLREMMEEVVQPGGTGTRAALSRYTCAGKTGTAQVVDPETGRYAPHKVTSVFVGFAPAANPRLAMAVVVHEPEGKGYGGVVAAPVFRRVMEKALPYLGVPPDKEPEDGPDRPRLVRWDGGLDWAQGPSVRTAPSSSQAQSQVVPDLRGLSLKAALAVLKAAGLEAVPKGSGCVVRQQPAPGEKIRRGGVVTLRLKELS
ncbi:peptidoglycan synthetase FtsI [Desulfacinum hydrothermale DSM 13146]|uniref:Peptidoglycan synthetase FtsI n=1 Tax=Desulfacinum hydrothermale DSM 13146 TaxID=1121390 RepID=A0A1W1XAZ9_9BACT|nr:penicillin-binding transpeptidase domain-containing protein [Desulfacinum hydrothermale]SMC20944.1 peptidoglycan synthetase FtsI [Desulfacinum hydrothermale DSM 13146]